MNYFLKLVSLVTGYRPFGWSIAALQRLKASIEAFRGSQIDTDLRSSQSRVKSESKRFLQTMVTGFQRQSEYVLGCLEMFASQMPKEEDEGSVKEERLQASAQKALRAVKPVRQVVHLLDSGMPDSPWSAHLLGKTLPDTLYDRLQQERGEQLRYAKDKLSRRPYMDAEGEDGFPLFQPELMDLLAHIMANFTELSDYSAASVGNSAYYATQRDFVGRRGGGEGSVPLKFTVRSTPDGGQTVEDREVPVMGDPDVEPDQKQIASGRFGVTIRYIVGGRRQEMTLNYIDLLKKYVSEYGTKQLTIKGGQGAKPARGGTLPGFKVDLDIALLRGLVSQLLGVSSAELEDLQLPDITFYDKTQIAKERDEDLVSGDINSSGTNEDLYSVEDLTLLINALKSTRPGLTICVKLACDMDKTPFDAIACIKAGADKLILTADGGTGSSPWSAQQSTGDDGMMTLAATHKYLVKEGVRDKITIVYDGGIRSGADMFRALSMGANKVGIGTAALYAVKCIMLKVCHETRGVTDEDIAQLLTEVEKESYTSLTPEQQRQRVVEIKNEVATMGLIDEAGRVSISVDPFGQDYDAQFEGLTAERMEVVKGALQRAQGGCSQGVATRDPLNSSKFDSPEGSMTDMQFVFALQLLDHLNRHGMTRPEQCVGRAQQVLGISEDSQWRGIGTYLQTEYRQPVDAFVRSPLAIPCEKDLDVIEKIIEFIQKGENLEQGMPPITVELTREDVSFGAAISGFCTSNNIDFPIHIRVKGIAPQNFGVWGAPNLTMIVEPPGPDEEPVNGVDHIGKGTQSILSVPGDIGNQCFYGATQTISYDPATKKQCLKVPELYAGGNAGEKAAIRNSGGTMVVGGNTGRYAAYFQTHGFFICHGELGEEPFVGMSGGLAFYQTTENNVSRTSHLRTRSLTQKEKETLFQHLQKHQALTRSKYTADFRGKTFAEHGEGLLKDYVVFDPTSLNQVTQRAVSDAPDETAFEFSISSADRGVGQQLAKHAMRKADTVKRTFTFTPVRENSNPVQFALHGHPSHMFRLKGSAGDYCGKDVRGKLVVQGSVGDLAGQQASGQLFIHGPAGYNAFQEFRGAAVVDTVNAESCQGMSADALVVLLNGFDPRNLAHADRGTIVVNRQAFEQALRGLTDLPGQPDFDWMSVLLTGAIPGLEDLLTDYRDSLPAGEREATISTYLAHGGLKGNLERDFCRIDVEKLKGLLARIPQPDHRYLETLRAQVGWEEGNVSMLRSMMKTGKEPHLSMTGAYAPKTLEAMSPVHLLRASFKQIVSPSLSTKDTRSFDLSLQFNTQGSSDLLMLDGHYLTPFQFDQITRQSGLSSHTISMSYACPDLESQENLYEAALDRICREAVSMAKQAKVIVLTHRASEGQILMDDIVVAAAVKTALRRAGLTNEVIVETASDVGIHHSNAFADVGVFFCPFGVLETATPLEEKRLMQAYDAGRRGYLAQMGARDNATNFGRYMMKPRGWDLNLLHMTDYRVDASRYLERIGTRDLDHRARLFYARSEEEKSPLSTDRNTNNHRNAHIKPEASGNQAGLLQQAVLRLMQGDILGDVESQQRISDRDLARPMPTEAFGPNSLTFSDTPRGSLTSRELGTHWAVVGAGPAGIYHAASLLDQGDRVSSVTIFADGIGNGVRDEVAPDHPGTKKSLTQMTLSKLREKYGDRIQIRYFSPIKSEQDVEFLCQNFSGVTFATGSVTRRHFEKKPKSERDPAEAYVVTGSKVCNFVNRKYGKAGEGRPFPIEIGPDGHLITEGGGKVNMDVVRYFLRAHGDQFEAFRTEVMSSPGQDWRGWDVEEGAKLKEQADKLKMISVCIRQDNFAGTKYDMDTLEQVEKYGNVRIQLAAGDSVSACKARATAVLTKLADTVAACERDFVLKQEELAQLEATEVKGRLAKKQLAVQIAILKQVVSGLERQLEETRVSLGQQEKMVDFFLKHLETPVKADEGKITVVFNFGVDDPVFTLSDEPETGALSVTYRDGAGDRKALGRREAMRASAVVSCLGNIPHTPLSGLYTKPGKWGTEDQLNFSGVQQFPGMGALEGQPTPRLFACGQSRTSRGTVPESKKDAVLVAQSVFNAWDHYEAQFSPTIQHPSYYPKVSDPKGALEGLFPDSVTGEELEAFQAKLEKMDRSQILRLGLNVEALYRAHLTEFVTGYRRAAALAKTEGVKSVQSVVKPKAEPYYVTVVSRDSYQAEGGKEAKVQFKLVKIAPGQTLREAIRNEDKDSRFRDKGHCENGSCHRCTCRSTEVLSTEGIPALKEFKSSAQAPGFLSKDPALTDRSDFLSCQATSEDLRALGVKVVSVIGIGEMEPDANVKYVADLEALKREGGLQSTVLKQATEFHQAEIAKLLPPRHDELASACAQGGRVYEKPVHVSSVTNDLIQNASRGAGVHAKTSDAPVEQQNPINSDGTGLATNIPHKMYQRLVKDHNGQDLPSKGNYGVLRINLPNPGVDGLEDRLTLLRTKLAERGLELIAELSVKTNDDAIGGADSPYAVHYVDFVLKYKPEVEASFESPQLASKALNRELDRFSLNLESAAYQDPSSGLVYLEPVSAGTDVLIWKGMFTPQAFCQYFEPYLTDEDYLVTWSQEHIRFSTTSLPMTKYAQPIRVIALNGETNSIMAFQNFLDTHARDITEAVDIDVFTANRSDTDLLGYYFQVMIHYLNSDYFALNLQKQLQKMGCPQSEVKRMVAAFGELSMGDLIHMSVQHVDHADGHDRSPLLNVAKFLGLPMIEGPGSFSVRWEGVTYTVKEAHGLRPGWDMSSENGFYFASEPGLGVDGQTCPTSATPHKAGHIQVIRHEEGSLKRDEYVVPSAFNELSVFLNKKRHYVPRTAPSDVYRQRPLALVA